MTVEEMMEDEEILEMVEEIEWMAYMLQGCSISLQEWGRIGGELDKEERMAETVYRISGEIKDKVYYPETCVPSVRAIDYLKGLPRAFLPKSLIHRGESSNSEVYRWLMDGSVVINGARPKPNEYIELPVTELVFFDKGKRKTTLVGALA